ncbi:hypothetical protein IE53DRAFT_84130 [Violaceomyces palustris]|uniref:Uncharacterized protein n=1 Tax=Violaceomyces palustris TaxID=1673888 RepID=A0ACD0NY03_9BASI|nr:hypothetical protein IE53DRAFT_84130 [Violaceomyces palustris]
MAQEAQLASNPRIVPGAPPPSSPSASSKSRKRKPKSPMLPSDADPSSEPILQSDDHHQPSQPDGKPANTSQDGSEPRQNSTGTEVEEVKKPAAITLLGKRMKAINKKLQRISSYESQDKSKLNPDQIRAISSKAGLQATLQELQEIAKAVEIAEKEETARIEARVNELILAAQAKAEASSKADLVLLLQFLHLHALFLPNQGIATFAPPDIPSALKNSTGQEVAAIGKVFDQLANGPLQGGSGDAFEIISSISSGSDEEVLPDVTYATVRKMILLLTAPPCEPDLIVSDAGVNKAASLAFSPADASADVSGLVQAQEEAGHKGTNGDSKIMFIQDSEIEEAQGDHAPSVYETQAGEPLRVAEGDAPQATEDLGGRELQPGPVEIPEEEGPSQVKGPGPGATGAETDSGGKVSEIIDWSADIDAEDFGQESLPSVSASISGTPVSVVSPPIDKPNGKERQRREHRPKKTVEVDEEGFITQRINRPERRPANGGRGGRGRFRGGRGDGGQKDGWRKTENGERERNGSSASSAGHARGRGGRRGGFAGQVDGRDPTPDGRHGKPARSVGSTDI